MSNGDRRIEKLEARVDELERQVRKLRHAS